MGVSGMKLVTAGSSQEIKTLCKKMTATQKYDSNLGVPTINTELIIKVLPRHSNYVIICEHSSTVSTADAVNQSQNLLSMSLTIIHTELQATLQLKSTHIIKPIYHFQIPLAN